MIRNSPVIRITTRKRNSPECIDFAGFNPIHSVQSRTPSTNKSQIFTDDFYFAKKSQTVRKTRQSINAELTSINCLNNLLQPIRNSWVSQTDAELGFDALIGKAARFRHEGQHGGGDKVLQFCTWQTRRMWQL